MLSALTSLVVPPWARWAALIVLATASYGLGRVQQAEHDAGAAQAQAAKVVTKVVTVVQHEVQTVTKVQTVYQDRIQKIYAQGVQLDERIPDLVSPDTDRRLPLPAGFVRVLDAAWLGTTVGPASDADSEPAAVPPSVVAANEADNATSCLVWREQALGWRTFYAEQQLNINGKVGDWYKPEASSGTEPSTDGAR
jgi:hypothetical protein